MEHVVRHARHLRERAEHHARQFFPVGLILTDVLLAAVLVVQFFSVYQFDFDALTNSVHWTWANDPTPYLALAGAFLVFLLFHLAIVRRHPAIRAFFSKLPESLKVEFREKKIEWTEDIRLPAVMVFDAFVICSIVLAVYAFLDPDLELIQWEKIGWGPPVTTAINAILFLGVLGVYYYLYRYTRPFRLLHRHRKEKRGVHASD